MPHLLGILLVAGAAIWGLTRPRKMAGALALVGASLALLVWLWNSVMSFVPLWSVRAGAQAISTGALFIGASSCATALLDLAAWTFIAAALVMAVRDQKYVDE